MLKNEGVSAFYTGLTAGLTRQVVYTGARLGLFDKFTGMVPLAGKKPSQPKEKCEVYVTPVKINMETKNHTIEKENHLNQTSIFGFHVDFRHGYRKKNIIRIKKVFQNHAKTQENGPSNQGNEERRKRRKKETKKPEKVRGNGATKKRGNEETKKQRTSNRDDVNTALDWVRLGRSNFLLPSMGGGMSPHTPAPTQPSGMLDTLLDMGVPATVARQACIQFADDLNAALDWICSLKDVT